MILKENDIGIESYFNERQQKEYEIARKKKDQDDNDRQRKTGIRGDISGSS